jgi:DNA-directed RNA polymerase alpha subunit
MGEDNSALIEVRAGVLAGPELPDDMPIELVPFPTRIRNVLAAAGLKTVGEVREVSDDTLLSFQDFGGRSLAAVRKALGLPSAERRAFRLK